MDLRGIGRGLARDGLRSGKRRIDGEWLGHKSGAVSGQPVEMMAGLGIGRVWSFRLASLTACFIIAAA